MDIIYIIPCIVFSFVFNLPIFRKTVQEKMYKQTDAMLQLNDELMNLMNANCCYVCVQNTTRARESKSTKENSSKQ